MMIEEERRPAESQRKAKNIFERKFL